MKKVAVINDLSGLGKCSLTAAIPVLSAMGITCHPLPTAVLTAQTGFPQYNCNDLTDMMPEYTQSWMSNQMSFDAIYTGYTTGEQQISHIFSFLDTFYQKDSVLLVDPVMGDDGAPYPIFSSGLLSSMRELCHRATILTPNLTEACLLTGEDYKKVTGYHSTADFLKKVEELAYKLQKPEQEVVITGIKTIEDDTKYIYNLALTADDSFLHKGYFFPQSFSGTGDLFASVLCGCKIKEKRIEDAIQLATDFLSASIQDTIEEKTPAYEGVCFEKHLGKLMK